MAAASFEPSMSSTFVRAPLSSAEAVSMADTIPSVNFGFDNLRERMAQFTTRFDDFIEKGRKKVLEDRNQYRTRIAELREDQRMRKRDLEILALKKAAHEQTLAKEAQETAEMHSAITSLTSQQEDRLIARDKLNTHLEDAQKEHLAKKEAYQKHVGYLDKQARYNEPELHSWEENLGLRIEGAGKEDRLKFVYTLLDEKDWRREFWFDISLKKRDYEVLACWPNLERDAVDDLLDKLNESRELGPFLKSMRDLFLKVA